jgi:hypothetical protein
MARGSDPIAMSVLIPMLTRTGAPCRIDQGSLRSHACAGAPDVIGLVNRRPVWNAERRIFQLDFDSRARSVSVKNFQLACPDIISSGSSSSAANIALQFGRVTTHSQEFVLDYRFPLNAMQAISVALARICHTSSFIRALFD